MSTVVGEQGSLSTVPVASILDRRGSLAAFAVGGLLAAVGGGLLLATSNHLVDPTAYGVQVAVTIVGAVSASLYWLVRRPGNRLGLLLLAFAVAATGLSLQGATQPLLHSIGVLADSAFFFLLYYVVFAFPEGRITSRLEWALLGALALYFLTTFFPFFFFSPVVSGGSPLAACNSACPANALMIADRPTIADGFFHISPISLSDVSYYLIVLSSAILVYLIYRLATCTRPRRRALLPVYVPALMVTASILVYYGVVADLLRLDSSTVTKVGWLLTTGYAALPYGFLLSIAASTFFAAAALKNLLERLAARPTTEQWRAMIASALDDDALKLGYYDPNTGRFRESDGEDLERPPMGSGRIWVPVDRDGRAVAAMVMDEALDEDPELVRAVASATLLAVENGELEGELRASQARVLEAGGAERRRIERDLHDSAQQRLVALRMHLMVAGERQDRADERAMLERFGAELDQAIDELRTVAHGKHPQTLNRGVGAALAAVADRSAMPISIQDAGLRRHSQTVETTVYYCCLECLQNAAKHAGPGASATIRLGEKDGRVSFGVDDDGAGFDPDAIERGAGLTNLADRVAAVGGTLQIDAGPGRGTHIAGEIPARS